jgi:hypothetical protein
MSEKRCIYTLIKIETIDWLETIHCGVFTDLEDIFISILSKLKPVQSRIFVSYALGHFKKNKDCFTTLLENIEPDINIKGADCFDPDHKMHDFYNYIVVETIIGEYRETELSNNTCSLQKILRGNADVIFYGSFANLIAFLVKEGSSDVSYHEPLADTAKKAIEIASKLEYDQINSDYDLNKSEKESNEVKSNEVESNEVEI